MISITCFSNFAKERSGSSRVLDSRPKVCGFEADWRHCVVSLSKTH